MPTSADTFYAANCPACDLAYDEQFYDLALDKAICSHCGAQFIADISADRLDIED